MSSISYHISPDCLFLTIHGDVHTLTAEDPRFSSVVVLLAEQKYDEAIACIQDPNVTLWNHREVKLMLENAFGMNQQSVGYIEALEIAANWLLTSQEKGKIFISDEHQSLHQLERP
jgi:hypothetical protein